MRYHRRDIAPLWLPAGRPPRRVPKMARGGGPENEPRCSSPRPPRAAQVGYPKTMASSSKAQAAIGKITEWLQAVYGPELVSLTLYGSRANGAGANGQGHRPETDVNLLCVLPEVTAERLEKGAEALRWWQRQGHRPIALWARDEVRDAADVFPIEYWDLQQCRRVLTGEDLFAEVTRFPHEHRQQVERELRTQLLRLRGRYPLAQDGKSLARLMTESAGTFITLFRHALAALGEPMLTGKEATAAAAAKKFGFEAEPWERILRARCGQDTLPKDRARLQPMFAAYLEAIQKVERQLEKA